MAKRPTEADLGIEPSADEIASQSAPVADQAAAPVEDDVVPREIEEEPDPQALTDREIADGKIRDPETGKFVKAKPEAQPAAPAAKPAPEAPPPGYVSVNALRESREENKRIMERMTTLLEMQTKREARAMQPKAAEPAAIPDKVKNPLEYIDYIDGRLASIETERTQTAQQREAQQREEQEMASVLGVASPQFEDAAKTDATVKPLYQELLNSFGRELMFINRNNPEFLKDQKGFLQAEMRKIENGHLKFAVASGQNVVEYMRGLAEAKGVKLAAPDAGQQQQAVPQQRSIEERQQQQQRHMSLGDAPGGEGAKPIDAKAIAKMSNKEFAAFASKMSEADLDALMGGRG